jgi:hypothetical protein
MALTITGKSLGARRRLFEDFAVPVPPGFGGNTGGGGGGDGGGNDGFRLRDLIAHIVRHEVNAFRERQEARRFVRALSEREIEAGVTKGKVEVGGSDLDQDVDEGRAVYAAIQAFEDGMYLCVLDGEEQRDLDARVQLTPDSTLTFIRLTFLAGA